MITEKSFDYASQWRELLLLLGYKPVFIERIINSYRFMISGESTPFNYYRFGKFFESMRSRAISSLDGGRLARAMKAFERLEGFIIPAMVTQNELDF